MVFCNPLAVKNRMKSPTRTFGSLLLVSLGMAIAAGPLWAASENAASERSAQEFSTAEAPSLAQDAAEQPAKKAKETSNEADASKKNKDPKGDKDTQKKKKSKKASAEKKSSRASRKPTQQTQPQEAAEASGEEKAGKDAEDEAGKEENAQETAKEEDAGEPSPPTVAVKPQRFRIEAELEGTFEAAKSEPMRIQPKRWGQLSVLSAVEHGARVKRDQVLVTLDLEKIDQEIADLRAQREIGELGIKLAELRLDTLEKTVPLDLDESQRLAKAAKEDYEFYTKTGRALNVRSIDFSLKAAQQRLDYEQEELRQLEKMYNSDDLTEETEEIVLKRARNDLERAKFYAEMYQIQHDRSMDFELPRQDKQMELQLTRSQLQRDRVQTALPMELDKQRLELETMKVQHQRAGERLEELQADREAMIIKAPWDGVVYYGEMERGKCGSIDSECKRLRPGGSLLPDDVFMTLVQSRPMHIRATVPEKQLHQIRAGVKGTARPAGYPDLRLTAIVDRVAGVPLTSGKFDARITVELPGEAEPLMPGMSCKVKLIAYEKKDALTVEPKAVVADKWDDRKHYVFVLDEQDKPKKQPVVLGPKTSKQVEIVEGISEGDKVLLEPPKAE